MKSVPAEEQIEFLEGYRRAKIDEENYKIESEALINCRIISSSKITGMPKARNGKKDLSQLEEFIEKCMQEYIGHRYVATVRAAEIVDCINRLDDELERKILLLRYIQLDNEKRLRGWNYIADRTGYSRAALYQYYRSALQHLQIPEKK
ncbi:MAG: hypothetical protein BHV87_07855 [Clostridiales bacterium 36_14]|nr:MAG: hypothetical protein BHV87_07855 [Clostridiales bacterium 36_14]